MLRVRTELKQTLMAYQELFETSIAWGGRKMVEAEEVELTELTAARERLEEEVRQLYSQVGLRVTTLLHLLGSAGLGKPRWPHGRRSRRNSRPSSSGARPRRCGCTTGGTTCTPPHLYTCTSVLQGEQPAEAAVAADAARLPPAGAPTTGAPVTHHLKEFLLPIKYLQSF